MAVEKIFAIPGLGRATLGASAAQNLPALQCGVLLLLLIATLSGTLGNLFRQLILGRALRSGSLPAPTISPTSRPHYAFPMTIALALVLLITVGLTRDPLAAHTAALVEEILARPYVRITPLLGVGRWYSFTGYVQPALSATRHALVRFPGITLALTVLGFLGLGQQPRYPEWGRIVAEGIPYIERVPWEVLAPVTTLMLLAILAVSLGQMTHSAKGLK